MTPHDPRLTRISWAIMAAGALGVVGGSFGWNNVVAASALLWATAVFDIIWGIVTILYVRFMDSAQVGMLARPGFVRGFHGAFLVSNLVLLVLSIVAIAFEQESTWLYLPLATAIVCEVLVLVWIKILISAGRSWPNRSQAET